MLNFDFVKKKIVNMSIDELIEFCGGDTCKNILCALVNTGNCSESNYKISYNCKDCIKKFLEKEI